MKKAVQYVLLTFAFSAILYCVAFLLLYKVRYKGKPLAYITNNYYNWKGGDTYSKFREFAQEKKYDVVILGSSRAYRGYSPFILQDSGYKAFNLGTSAQSVKNSYFLLKNYLDNNNCGLLIFDIFAGSFAPNQLESSADLIQNVDRIEAAAEISMSNPDIRTMNIMALRMMNENDTAYFRKPDYAGKGYSFTNDSLRNDLRLKVIKQEKIAHRPFSIDPEQLDYFRKIIEISKERKVKTVFVYSPVSYFYDQQAHLQLMKEIQPLFLQHSLPFYDFSQCDAIRTVDHFYDESHLNQRGVEVFNQLLYTRLKTDRIL